MKMSKTLEAKKVNRMIKKLNRSLQKDVYGDRFYCWQIQKSFADGIELFRFKLTDKEQPERNCETRWFNIYEVEWKVWNEMNDFIVFSDFWKKYRENK